MPPVSASASEVPWLRNFLTNVSGWCRSPRPAVGLLLAGISACTPDVPELPPLPPRAADVDGAAPGAPRPLREALVVWTAAVRGEIEACGCPTVPYGGLGRRAKLLERLRGLDVPVFTLDAGDMLVKGSMSRGPDSRRERAQTLLGLMSGLGLDAWAPSPGDLVPGGAELLTGSGALSATWPGFPGARVISRGGFELGVLGISAPDGQSPATDVVEAARRAMAAASTAAGSAGGAGDGVDLWVALSNADGATNRRLVAEIPEIGVVLGERAESDTAAPVLSVPDRGRYVGMLHVAMGSTPGALRIVEDGPVERLAEHRARMADSTDPAWDGRQQVPALRDAVAQLASGHNLAWVDRRPLGSDLDGISPLDPALAKTRVDVTASAQARAETTPSGYVSGAACVRCHSDYFAAWSYSPHAQAFGPLLTRGASTNPECLSCHTTGYGEPGGFGEPSDANLSRFKAVQCEACHGPLAGHPERGTTATTGRSSADLARDPNTCLGCHDEANSPQFDYGTYLGRVSCVHVKRSRDEATVPAGLR